MALGYISANLPSRGRLYGDKFLTGQVDIRRMTVGEEVILQTTTEGPARVSALLAACCKFPDGFDQSQLIVGDRDALLLAIRVYTFGSKYGFSTTCGACGHGYRANTDLVTDIKSFPLDDSFTEPFVLGLPDSGVTAGFRLLRGKDEEAMLKELKKTDGIHLAVYQLALQLVSVDGKALPLDERIAFVKNLPLGDAYAAQEALEAKTPKLSYKVPTTCPKCSEKDETEVPLDVGFFRPTRNQAV